MAISLQELATRLKVELRGDGAGRLTRVADLRHAEADCLTFLGDRRYAASLAATRAGGVILDPADAPACPVPALVTTNPYLTFARAARLLHPEPPVTGGCHPSAIVADSAAIDPSAWVGPLTVVEADVVVERGVFIGPGCILGAGSRVGADSRLVARVTLCAGTSIGQRALLHPGCVIGRDGFGFAKDGDQWVRIPQIGQVRIGNDVEIGANTTVDRGTLGDTLIGDGVKIDNLVQIGHNVEIGQNTAMAACSGISGSTRIGRDCLIGGAVGMAGHLQIGDAVHFTGMAMVTRSFPEPGSYSGGIPAMSSAEWRRAVARFRQLDELARRLKRLEDQRESE